MSAPDRALALLLLLLLLILGCEGRRERRAGHAAQSALPSVATSQVVSTVDRTQITLREVEELVLAGLSPAEALRRLQGQSLLMSEADRRGVDDNAPVEQVGRQAAVQALLESETRAVEVSSDELRAEYTAQFKRFGTPERRIAAHVLVRPAEKGARASDADARQLAAQIGAAFAQASDVDAFLRRQSQSVSAGLDVIAERLPPVPRDGVGGALGDALFALAKPGNVSEPVRTKHGWHVIRLLEIVAPEVQVSFEAASPGLRDELLLRKRTQRVTQLVAALRDKYPVSIAPDARAALERIVLE